MDQPEVIDRETGETLPTVGPPSKEVSIVPVLQREETLPVVFDLEAAKGRYDEVLAFLNHVAKDDWLQIKTRDGPKPYLKIEGLQKLANGVELSTPIVERWEKERTGGVREFWYHVACRGKRRETHGIGCCSTGEPFARGKEVSAIAGMALTRATGSAIRRYFGLTGPSAEEMGAGGDPPEDAHPGHEDVPDEPIRDAQRRMIFAASTKKGYTDEEVRAWIHKRFKVASTNDLSMRQASETIDLINQWPTADELRAERSRTKNGTQ